MKFPVLLIFASLFLTSHGQTTRDVACAISVTALGYTCSVSPLTLVGVTNISIKPTGHQEGRTNNDVEAFLLGSTLINFVPQQIFQTFPNLKRIFMHRSNLPKIESRYFRERSRLDHIDLSNSAISVLDQDALIYLTELKTLILSFNSISILPNGIFKSLTSLETLELQFNRLTRLEANLFAYSPRLSSLNMRNNDLTFISSSTFARNSRFINLDLANNDCINNTFANIPEGGVITVLEQLTSCSELHPVLCIFDINEILTGPATAYTCTIEGTSLTDRQRLVAFVGSHLVTKTDLDVTNLRIKYSNIPFFMEQIFTTFPNLNSLEINGGGLRELRGGEFINGNRLSLLKLEHNNLNVLGNGIFQGLVGLHWLDLSRNEIEFVRGNAFHGLLSLQSLDLSGNLIKRLSRNTLNPLNNLIHLIMNNNYMTRASAFLFLRNENLLTVDMSSNQISAIETNFLRFVPHLGVLSLADNVCTNDVFLPVNVEEVNMRLRECYNAYNDLPSEGTRRVLMDMNGEVDLIAEDGIRIEL